MEQVFEHVSRLAKLGRLGWREQERIEDLKRSLEQLLDGMITGQKETIQAREASQQLSLKTPGVGPKEDTAASKGVA